MAEVWKLLGTHPIATASSAIVYAVLFSLLFREPRVFFGERLTIALAKGRTHLGGFDTLRGFAAALVALAHSWH